MKRLHTVTIGAGPDVVLLHGWGLQGGVLAPLARALARNHRVTRVDLPGYGGSLWQPQISDLDSLAASIMPAVPEGAALLGWSLGGLMSLELARTGLRDVAALVLIGSTPRFVATGGWECAVRRQDFDALRNRLTDDPSHCVDDFAVLAARGDARAAEVLRGLRASPQAATPEALQVGLDILAAADLRAELRRIEVPALIVAGGRDRLVPAAAARFLAAALPCSHVYPLPDAAHAPFIGREAALAAAIDSFLAAHARTAA